MIYEVDVYYQGIYTVQIEAVDEYGAEQLALGSFDNADWPHDSCPHMTNVAVNEYTKADYKKDVGV